MYKLSGYQETFYLEKPFKIEAYVAEYLISKIESDPFDYDTPLDTEIVVPDRRSGDTSGADSFRPRVKPGTYIRRSAQFTKVLSQDQINAIQGALDHPICIITGGAGTGKTTCIKEIVHNLKIQKKKFALCSFTGKAVSRIRQVTGEKNASTIHRLISGGRGDTYEIKVFSENPFEVVHKDMIMYDVIVIDEASMVTMELFYRLITTFPTTKRFVFVGDMNQLPPIGWGAMFAEMIKSGTVPRYLLTINHRVLPSGPGSIDGIVSNANAIISHDSNYPFEFVEQANFAIMNNPEKTLAQQVYDTAFTLFKTGVDVKDIVVITPYNRNLNFLNKEMQKIFNKNPNRITDSRGIIWIVGDKVMLNENDQNIGVYNGEEGIVCEVTTQYITVNFGVAGAHDFNVEPLDPKYPKKDRNVLKLNHSYALTVDKSQGSEWQFVLVFLPADAGDNSFLNKNRIYTAITRTQVCCWLIGDIKMFNKSAGRPMGYRCENLHKRLIEKLPNIPISKIKLVKAERAGEMNNEPAEQEIPPDDYFGVDPDDF